MAASARTGDAGLHVALHPLVILTISDLITRHSLRSRTNLLVGGLLGQQNGREITIEVAYDTKATKSASGDASWRIDEDLFATRLQQYKEVHKDPILDLVGFWVLAPLGGPREEIRKIHEQVTQHNENALILCFHPDGVFQGDSDQVKLPITVYDVQGDDGSSGTAKARQMKEVPFEIVTGEAEMISMDFVAKGGGNATAVRTGEVPVVEAGSSKQEKGGKDGEGADTIKPTSTAQSDLFTPEEEELLSFLTNRANAIKLLKSRVDTMKAFLASLPPSYLTDASLLGQPSEAPQQIPHTAVRAILSLTSRLPALTASSPTSASTPSDFQNGQSGTDTDADMADVALVELLGTMGRSVQAIRELGGKFSSVDGSRRDPSAGLRAGRGFSPTAGSGGGYGGGYRGGIDSVLSSGAQSGLTGDDERMDEG